MGGAKESPPRQLLPQPMAMPPRAALLAMSVALGLAPGHEWARF